MKIKKIITDGRRIDIYIKIPFYSNFLKMNNKLKEYYDKDASFDNFIDITGKYIIMSYMLRNKKDILPYIKYSESR